MDSQQLRDLIHTGTARRSGPKFPQQARECAQIGARLWVLIPEGAAAPQTREEALALDIHTDLLPRNWTVVVRFPGVGVPARAVRVTHAGGIAYLLIPDAACWAPGLSLEELRDLGCARAEELPVGVEVVEDRDLTSRAHAAARSVARAVRCGRVAYLPGALPG